MTIPRLHLDADTSIKALQKVLHERGYDVTHTPNEWMPLDADDRTQLLGAAAQGRILFTFNISNFWALVPQYPVHHGLLLATQNRWSLRELIDALDCMMSKTEAEEWIGQVRWLHDWKRK